MKNRSTINDCKIVSLSKELSDRGNLTYVYPDEMLGFDIKRTYYLYDIPGGSERGGHAHKNLKQLIVSVMGAFDVVIDDGVNRKIVRLDRAYKGLLMPNMIWRELENFSSGAVCVVLASELYEENDYIRDYESFKESKKV